MDKYFIDDEVKHRIRKLSGIKLQDYKSMEVNFKYCYSELVWAYDKISTLQALIQTLEKEVNKAKDSAKAANEYINTILLSNKQKTKNEKVAVKMQCKEVYATR